MGALHLGGETIEYTDNPFELYIQQKLEKQGIDVSMDDYIMNPKFKELFFSFVTEKWNSVTEAWWVEEHFCRKRKIGTNIWSIRNVSDVQHRTANCITNCKTGGFGYNVSYCEECGHLKIHACACNNRSCPNCQTSLHLYRPA